MNQHPRSFTADENRTPAERMLDGSSAVLRCGHGIDEALAMEILAADPNEAVWCTDCQADFPVATAEFLEDMDADETLVLFAKDREAEIARALPAPFEPEVDADGRLVVDADENITVPLACGHTEKVFARSSQWDFPTEERRCPVCGSDTTWDPAFVARLVDEEEDGVVDLSLRCGHTKSVRVDAASYGDPEAFCDVCDRVVLVGECPTELRTLGDFADTAASHYENGYGPITVVRLGAARKGTGATYRLSTVLPDCGHDAEVTVQGPRMAFGSLQPPTVNWSAIGSQSPTDAMTYATLIQASARLAFTAEGPVQ
jgi:hypothetical protein